MHLLREIVRTHQAMMAAFSRTMGVPGSRFALMRVLASAKDGIGVMEIAAQLGINAAAVVRQVNELESEGVVRRRADTRDGRRNYVSLSVKGAKLFSEMHERSHALEHALVAKIGAEKMIAAAEVLASLRECVGTIANDRLTAVP